MKYIRRLKEPSSLAGLATISQVLKMFAPAWAVVFDCATALLGSLAVAIPEKGSNAA